MPQMMSLGGFVFSLSEGTPYEGLQRTSDGGWVAVARYGQKPMSQNTGQQLENIALTVTWFQSQGMIHLAALRALQNQRAPLVLADGYGNHLGQWTIKRLQPKLVAEGILALNDTFSSEIKGSLICCGATLATC